MLLLGVPISLTYLFLSASCLFVRFSELTPRIWKNPFQEKSNLKKPQIGLEEAYNYNNYISNNKNLSFVSTIFKVDSIIDKNERFLTKLLAFPNSSYKSRPPDLASLLLSERIVYIGYPIQQTVAHLVISQLLYLDYDSQEKPIKIYINSDNDHSTESGLSTSEIDALNIVDVMNYLKNEVITINLGKAYGPAAVILASGTPGKRYVLPRSYTLLRQSPTTISFRQAEDIAIYSDEILKARKSIIKVLSKVCRKNESEILEKINIGDYMDSQDTVNFGLADKVLEDIKLYNLRPVKRGYSAEKGENTFDQLIKKLDVSLKKASGEQDKHQRVVDIAKEFLTRKYTFYENSVFLSKICNYGQLKEDFWTEYISSLNETLSSEGKDAKEFKEGSVNDLKVLSSVSKSLIKAKLVSKPLAQRFMKNVMRNVLHIIPYKIETFNSMLDYLVHAEHKEPFPEIVFEVLVDFSSDIRPQDLIHIMYSLGSLGHKNEEMFQTFSRILHNNIAKGLLTPFEKTKLAKAYALMKHEHITFFNHISKELMIIFNKMDFGNYFKNDQISEGDKQGLGSPLCKPSGVMVDALKYIHFRSSESNQIQKEPKEVEFRGVEEQLYTCGQIVYILDSMIYLKLHHLEPDFKKLVNQALKHVYKKEIVSHFDPEQLRACVSLLATCRKSCEDNLLEFMTKRFVKEYLNDNATGSQLALFLKDLVKLTKVVVKRMNIRNKILHNSNFIPPKWINGPLEENIDMSDPNATRSILEKVCYKMCDNVNKFNMNDLTSCLRSIAYLGYRNDKFYTVFVPYFRDNLESLNHVCVSNLTQSFNKANVRDKFFFYLLGKQHQLHLHNVEDKVYIKRIG